MPVPSMSLHVIKMHMAFQFICLATFIYTFEFIFLFPLGTVTNTVQLKGEEGVFFQLAVVDVQQTLVHYDGCNLDFNLDK